MPDAGPSAPAGAGSSLRPAAAARAALSAKRVSRRAPAEATVSSGSSAMRPSPVAVPPKVRVVPSSAGRSRTVRASRTVPLPRASVASPSRAYEPSSRRRSVKAPR
ncbi:hypothetical protein AB7952_12990 [Streptomyces sp. PG2]